MIIIKKKDKGKLIDEIEAIIEKEINSNKIDFNFMHEKIRRKLLSFNEKERVLEHLDKDNTLIELLVLRALPLINNNISIGVDSVFWEIIELLISHGNYMSKYFFKKHIDPVLKYCASDKNDISLTKKRLVIDSIFSVKEMVVNEDDFINFVLSMLPIALENYLLLKIKSNKNLLFSKVNFLSDKNKLFKDVLRDKKNVNIHSYSMKLLKAEIFLPEKISESNMRDLIDFMQLDLNLLSSNLIDGKKKTILKYNLFELLKFLTKIKKSNKVPYFKLIAGIENDGSVEAYNLCVKNILNIDNFINGSASPAFESLDNWEKVKTQLEIELFNYRSSNEDEFNL